MRGRAVLDVGLGAVGDVGDVLIADPEDLDQHRGLAVEARRQIGVGETVHHRRDLAEGETACRPGG